jgi:hypothetical protein
LSLNVSFSLDANRYIDAIPVLAMHRRKCRAGAQSVIQAAMLA